MLCFSRSRKMFRSRGGRVETRGGAIERCKGVCREEGSGRRIRAEKIEKEFLVSKS